MKIRKLSFKYMLALSGALLGFAISAPFATAYFRAYEPGVGPPWMIALIRTFPELFEFATRPRSYQVYGRYYSLVIPLTIPALLDLKNRIGLDNPKSVWRWRVFFWGVLMMGVGIIGDYWPGQESFWIGVGFMFELIGVVFLGVGAILFSGVAFGEGAVSRWIGFGILSTLPFGFVGIALLAHIPSGPLFGYIVFWLMLGINQLFGRSEAGPRK